jgi:GcrA cell cycle regulator
MAKPSPARLQEALTYDPTTGVCHWKIPPRRNIPAGHPAGGRHHNGNVVGIDGAQILVKHLAWLFTHGEWPKATLTTRNKDKYDDRIENIIARAEPWTDERDAKLTELWLAGTSKRQIVILLKCGEKSLNRRITFLGLPPQVKAAPVDFIWTDERDEIVRTLISKTLYAVARQVGCSQRRVERRAKELGVIWRHIGRPSECPAEHLDIIRENWPKPEMSATEIGKLIGCTKGSVIGRARRLGLGQKPKRPVRTDTRDARRATRPQAIAVSRYMNTGLKYARCAIAKAKAKPSKQRRPPDYRAPERDGPKFRKDPTFFASIPSAPDERNISILDLNHFTCHWPNDNRIDGLQAYCGALTTDGTPYCPYHRTIMYQPRSSASQQNAYYFRGGA